MLQENEVINLIMSFISLLIIAHFCRKGTAVVRNFSIAFIFLFSAFLCTVLEGFVWPDLFNSLEHLSFAIAGLLFTVSCLLLRKKDLPEENSNDQPDCHF